MTDLVAMVLRAAAALCAAATACSADVPPPPPQWLSPSSVFNAPLAPDAPLDPASGPVVDRLVRDAQRTTIGTDSYGATLYEVPADQPRRRVRLTASAPLLQEALASVPIPADAHGSAGTDGAAIVVQESTDTAWEFWRLRRADSGGLVCDWAGRVTNLSRHPSAYFDRRDADGHLIERWFWGITAAKLPKVGGLITVDDLRRGRIDHALAIAVPRARERVFAAPARATDGDDPSSDAVPEGAHLRLDPQLDIASLNLPRPTRMLARAAQRYGLIVNNGTHGAVMFVAQDPTTLPSDPYPELFDGMTPHEVAAAFPWEHLKLLRMTLRGGG